MRIAVTGATGFVGRHTVRELAARGVEVIAISRRPDPAALPNVVPLALDIATTGTDGFDKIGRPDALLHLAWGGLPHYQSVHHLENELPVHIAFLSSCLGSGLSRLVVTGTCLEYGLLSGALDEGDACVPSTCYGKAKNQLRQQLQQLRAAQPFALSWLRLFYLYGPGQAPTSLYAQLSNAVENGTGSFDMSAGEQVRDFLPIEKAASLIAKLTLHCPDAGVVNICSGQPATVRDRVAGWLGEWNAELTLNRGVHPYPAYEPFAFWGNPGKLHSLLDAI